MARFTGKSATRTSTSTSTSTKPSGSYQSGGYDRYYSSGSGDGMASNVESAGRSEDLWNESLMNRNLDREFGRQSAAFNQQATHEKSMARQNVSGQKSLMNSQGFWDIRKSQVDAQNQMMLASAGQGRRTIRGSSGGGGYTSSYGGGGGGGSSHDDAAGRAEASALARERMALDRDMAAGQLQASKLSTLTAFAKHDPAYWR